MNISNRHPSSSLHQKALECALAGLVTALATGLLATQATAATATSPIAVSANVQALCTNSASTLPFNVYTGALINATATLTIQCTNTTPYNVGLDPGLSTGATVTNRAMVNGAALLHYGLYQDTGHLTNWGNTTGTWLAGTGTGAVQTITVYGQVPAGQFVTPGAYADTITATVNY